MTHSCLFNHCVQLFETNRTRVALQLSEFCLKSGLGNQAQCGNLTAEVNVSSPSGNKGKRAGFICEELGHCDMKAIGAVSGGSCVLSINTLSATAAAGVTTINGSTLDYCTAEGVQGGTVLPGIAPNSSFLPIGTCGKQSCPH